MINRGFALMPLLIDLASGRSLLHEELSQAFQSDLPIHQALMIARQHFKGAIREPSPADRIRVVDVPSINVGR
jgi:hypothetical protein